jgi:prephenate dehydratase
MSVTIAIQGDKASFHDIAAANYFGESGRRFCATFAETVRSVKDSEVDYALCAIENSLYGSINEVYDLILKNQLYITGEVYLRIEQCLIGLPGTKIAEITHVHSHPVALAQCDAYLNAALPDAERSEYHDTAASVEMIKKIGDPTQAAIAGAAAAELYGMEILAHSIETNKQNYTRFVVLRRTMADPHEAHNKTSLVLRTDHTPGSLYRALGSFAERSINLSKIQSRPVVGEAWRYIMYLDLEIGAETPEFKQSAKELLTQDCEVTVLGSYRNALQS